LSRKCDFSGWRERKLGAADRAATARHGPALCRVNKKWKENPMKNMFTMQEILNLARNETNAAPVFSFRDLADRAGRMGIKLIFDGAAYELRVGSMQMFRSCALQAIDARLKINEAFLGLAPDPETAAAWAEQDRVLESAGL
jgi:hypothetical protein